MKSRKSAVIASALISALPILAFAGDPPATQPAQSGAAAVVNPNSGPRVFIQGNADAPGPFVPGMPNVVFRTRLAREKGAYLGVSATHTSPVLQQQLGLPEGMGLIVDFIVPESPAATAGLKPFDVLQKLDDQLLINSEQLAVLVRSHKPGDDIKLTAIRQGKPLIMTTKLVEHDLEPLAEIEQMQAEVAEQMRHMLPEPGVHPVLPGNGPMRFQIQANSGANGASSFSLLDGDRSYTINIDHAGHKSFTVKDKDGRNLFDGLIETPEQRTKLPEDLKARLDHMEQIMPHDGKVGADTGGPEEKK